MKLLEDSITKTLLQLGHEMSTNNTNSDTSAPEGLCQEGIANSLEVQLTEEPHPLQIQQDENCQQPMHKPLISKNCSSNQPWIQAEHFPYFHKNQNLSQLDLTTSNLLYSAYNLKHNSGASQARKRVPYHPNYFNELRARMTVQHIPSASQVNLTPSFENPTNKHTNTHLPPP